MKTSWSEEAQHLVHTQHRKAWILELSVPFKHTEIPNRIHKQEKVGRCVLVAWGMQHSLIALHIFEITAGQSNTPHSPWLSNCSAAAGALTQVRIEKTDEICKSIHKEKSREEWGHYNFPPKTRGFRQQQPGFSVSNSTLKKTLQLSRASELQLYLKVT